MISKSDFCNSSKVSTDPKSNPMNSDTDLKSSVIENVAHNHSSNVADILDKMFIKMNDIYITLHGPLASSTSKKCKKRKREER